MQSYKIKVQIQFIKYTRAYHFNLIEAKQNIENRSMKNLDSRSLHLDYMQAQILDLETCSNLELDLESRFQILDLIYVEDLFLFCKNLKSSRPFSFNVTMLWLNLKRKKKLDLDLDLQIQSRQYMGKKKCIYFPRKKIIQFFFPRQIENDIV